MQTSSRINLRLLVEVERLFWLGDEHFKVLIILKFQIAVFKVKQTSKDYSGVKLKRTGSLHFAMHKFTLVQDQIYN